MFGAKLNKQPGPLNEEALQMLRDQHVKRLTDVVTADDQIIGGALRIHLWPEEANPDLKLYAAILEIISYDFGMHYYVPTDFIKEYADSEQLILSVPLSVVEEEQWSREPTFIAGHLAEIEELAG